MNPGRIISEFAHKVDILIISRFFSKWIKLFVTFPDLLQSEYQICLLPGKVLLLIT
jgi:hypothetical protein